MQQVFKDLKIVELASVLAGPTVGLFFAELGAKVVKIENKTTSGDVTRNWKLPGETGKISAYYSSANWNKESILLNLKDNIDLGVLHEHISDADILITNFKKGDDKKFNLDYETLKTSYPQLIIGEIIGFSNSEHRVAYDVVLQAETGFMSMNGTPESGPIKMPVAMMDLLAAHQLKEGLLVALIRKGKTQKGSKVTVSLEESGLASLANQASNYLMSKHVAQLMGSLHPNIAPYGEIFECKNREPIVLAVGSDSQFRSLCLILDAQNLADDERFSNNTLRVINRKALDENLSPLFHGKDRDSVLSLFHKSNVPAAAIKNLDEVLESRAAKNMILEETIEGVITKRISTVAFRIED